MTPSLNLLRNEMPNIKPRTKRVNIFWRLSHIKNAIRDIIKKNISALSLLFSIVERRPSFVIKIKDAMNAIMPF